MFLVIRTPTCVSRALVLRQGTNTLDRNLADAPNFLVVFVTLLPPPLQSCLPSFIYTRTDSTVHIQPDDDMVCVPDFVHMSQLCARREKMWLGDAHSKED